jgi:hypothetical protein
MDVLDHDIADRHPQQMFQMQPSCNWGQMKNKDTQESVVTSSKVSDQYLHHEWQQQLAPISTDKLIQLLTQGANKYYKQ